MQTTPSFSVRLHNSFTKWSHVHSHRNLVYIHRKPSAVASYSIWYNNSLGREQRLPQYVGFHVSTMVDLNAYMDRYMVFCVLVDELNKDVMEY